MSDYKKSNRPAPAYQEYASDILANRAYRAMTLAERGLWDTIRKECWVNGSVPSSKPELARYLGLPHDIVNELLTPNLMKWFRVLNNDLICPELNAYRLEIEGRRQRMSDGGRSGGRKTQSNRRNISEAPLQAKVKPLSRDEMSRDEQRGGESSNKNILSDEDEEWLKGYGDGKPPQPSEYLKQSRGY
jgi:hypothetical protein